MPCAGLNRRSDIRHGKGHLFGRDTDESRSTLSGNESNPPQRSNSPQAEGRAQGRIRRFNGKAGTRKTICPGPNRPGAAYIELCKNSPTGIGGRGSSLKILSFSGKNQDGICLSLASSGRSSSPLLDATGPPYPTGAWTLGPAVLGAELAATRDGEIASGSPERAFTSASGPCSDF